MRLEHLVLRGFTHAFPGTVDLPLRALDEGLVALIGPNGKGKTTLLESMGPAPIFRVLPSRNGADPVDYATSRESYLELEFSTDSDRFRSRLNLDGPKRASDAVLEVVLRDGSRAALNDGKRTTYDEQIRKRFPSIDLFINSAFAAQGRGDEFTRRKPSQRKDLFAEFLSLGHYAAMAKTAAMAADLYEDARMRLEARVETLERETADTVRQALDVLANELQVTGAAAELRQPVLQQEIVGLEARIALLTDSTAAHAAATLRVRDVLAHLTERRDELARARSARAHANIAAKADLDTITRRSAEQLADLAQRVAGNEQIQARGPAIRAAVAALPALETDVAGARERLQQRQTRWTELSRARLDAGAAVNAFLGPQKDLDHARASAALLHTVPCGGEGPYAACQFLVNATAAQGRIAALETTLAGLAAAIARRDAVDAEVTTLDAAIAEIKATVARLDAEIAGHKKTAAYEKALIDSDARLAELRTKRTELAAAAAADVEAAQARHHQRTIEFDATDLQLQDAIRRLETEHKDALNDVALAGEKTTQSSALHADLAAARAAWDQVTATLASVASRRQDLDRRRQDVDARQRQLVDVRARLGRVQQELVEWRDLAKSLGKGGLPDLEIDAAGPSITALTNDLLTSCFGPRFTVELVTQVPKADGGMKDEFTVKVFDNEAGGDWRDISDLSGGEKVVVQEALMCAISIYVNERSPMPIRTLWRDETGAALDPENAVRYVTMLRKVRELGAFIHVFFISHNPAASALADAQIQVGGGTARIVLPPFVGQEAA